MSLVAISCLRVSRAGDPQSRSHESLATGVAKQADSVCSRRVARLHSIPFPLGLMGREAGDRSHHAAADSDYLVDPRGNAAHQDWLENHS